MGTLTLTLTRAYMNLHEFEVDDDSAAGVVRRHPRYRVAHTRLRERHLERDSCTRAAGARDERKVVRLY